MTLHAGDGPCQIPEGFGRPVPDYTAMEVGLLLRELGDDAQRWAEAFVQHAHKVRERGDDPLDVGWLTTWFANAIEHSSDVRRWRSEPSTRPVLTDTLRRV